MSTPTDMWCEYCRKDDHNDSECSCTRPADWSPERYTFVPAFAGWILKDGERSPNEEVVERTRRALAQTGSPLTGNQWWKEVTIIPGTAVVLEKGQKVCFFEGSEPEIYVVRGSQLYRLWEVPELPSKDTSKTSMREE